MKSSKPCPPIQGSLTLLLFTTLLFTMTTACDLLGSDDEQRSDTDRSDRQRLVTWEEIGLLERDRIVGIYPEANPLLLSHDVTLYRLVYETLDSDGEPVLASGALLIPHTDSESPLLMLQRGTLFHNQEAPSQVGLDDAEGDNNWPEDSADAESGVGERQDCVCGDPGQRPPGSC